MKFCSFALIILISHVVLADFMQQPAQCLKKQSAVCSVWAKSKIHLPRAGVQVFASADSLFEIKTGEIYHIRGSLWIVSERPFTIKTRYGSVATQATSGSKGEMWSEATEEYSIFRSLNQTLSVTARGAQKAMDLRPGFESRITYVNRDLRMAEASWPVSINFVKHLREFHELVPSEEVFKEKTASYASVIKGAVAHSAFENQRAVDRQVASAKKTDRLKSEVIAPSGRDSFLRKLFRQKNNFSE